MSSSPTKPRIAWLVNLYGDPVAQHTHGAEILRGLCRQLGAVVVPVYCLEPAVATGALGSVSESSARAESAERLNKLLKSLRVPSAGEPLVISPGDLDQSMGGRAAAAAAAIAKARVLFTLVHTHARSAAGRFFFGSFSEEFISRSTRPMLIVNPYAEQPENYARITYATDFSDPSVAAFKKLLPFAKTLGASVTIDHQITVKELPLFMSGAATRKQYKEELLERENAARALAKPMERAASRAEVSCTVTVHLERGAKTAAAGILKRAKADEASVIALAARGDVERPMVFGGTARWLMRRADRPVLVFPAG